MAGSPRCRLDLVRVELVRVVPSHTDREFRITRSPGDLLRLTRRQVAGQCNSFPGDADGKRLPGLQARARPRNAASGGPFGMTVAASSLRAFNAT